MFHNSKSIVAFYKLPVISHTPATALAAGLTEFFLALTGSCLAQTVKGIKKTERVRGKTPLKPATLDCAVWYLPAAETQSSC